MVTAGFYDIVLACGSEKLYHVDKGESSRLLQCGGHRGAGWRGRTWSSVSSPEVGEPFDAAGAGVNRSIFMDIYSVMATAHMKKYGSTKEHFAMVAAKNSFHGSLNPRAQFQELLTSRTCWRRARSSSR